MQKFKVIDCWVSIILIIVFTIAGIINYDSTFLIGYLVVGGWQVISMIVHVYAGLFMHKAGARYVYHCITIVTLITLPFGSYLVLLFTAPFMALYYTYLCYRETYVFMKRPLSILK